MAVSSPFGRFEILANMFWAMAGICRAISWPKLDRVESTVLMYLSDMADFSGFVCACSCVINS